MIYRTDAINKRIKQSFEEQWGSKNLCSGHYIISRPSSLCYDSPRCITGRRVGVELLQEKVSYKLLMTRVLFAYARICIHQPENRFVIYLSGHLHFVCRLYTLLAGNYRDGGSERATSVSPKREIFVFFHFRTENSVCRVIVALRASR